MTDTANSLPVHKAGVDELQQDSIYHWPTHLFSKQHHPLQQNTVLLSHFVWTYVLRPKDIGQPPNFIRAETRDRTRDL